MWMRAIVLLMRLLALASPVGATCTWVGSVGQAANASDTEVTACVLDASSKTGAVTINIPAGTPSWSTGVTINMASGWANVTSLTIAGAGSSSTIITDATGTGATQVPIYGTSITKPLRITALEITGGGDSYGQINIGGSTSSLRIDHCTFSSYATRALWIQAGGGGVPMGVIDPPW